MLRIRIKQKDGFEHLDRAETLQEGFDLIDRYNAALAGDCCTADLGFFYPLRWEMIDEDTRDVERAGFVDETGLYF